ncbi:MAG: hypothetical protein Ta2E_11650 [Mycoplasmoidaceae bacterium]|nr:MAG: hypothetical protein Ta2E_11650 [Mycoplasmoidaceae bacterium]
MIFDKRFGCNVVKNLFRIKNARFYSRDPNDLSLFQGYPYERFCESISPNNATLVNPFLEHVRHVICSYNISLIKFVISWISFLIQKPGSKTEIALILIGEQSTGKNMLTLTYYQTIWQICNN